MSSVVFETVKSQREEKRKKKTWFRDNFLYFQILQTFGNLEINLTSTYTSVLDKLWILSELLYFFAKMLTNSQFEYHPSACRWRHIRSCANFSIPWWRVGEFWYATSARITAAWKGFRQLLPIITNRGAKKSG